MLTLRIPALGCGRTPNRISSTGSFIAVIQKPWKQVRVEITPVVEVIKFALAFALFYSSCYLYNTDCVEKSEILHFTTVSLSLFHWFILPTIWTVFFFFAFLVHYKRWTAYCSAEVIFIHDHAWLPILIQRWYMLVNTKLWNVSQLFLSQEFAQTWEK